MAPKSKIPKSNYVALISFILISESIATAAGFTTDLIHRDSPQSPSYDPSFTPTQRLINAVHRSVHRAGLLSRRQRSKPEPQPDLTRGGGEYLMKFAIGTPPVPTIAIADTGSDVVWTQCSPCLHCINQSLPLFSSRASASYARIPCKTPTCDSLRRITTSCSRTRQNCRYLAMYGDGSYTDGILATEKFTFPSSAGTPIVVPDVIFGCGFRNGGVFSGIESGIVGLGGGSASLVTQLGKGKFSYCLVPIEDRIHTSKLNFGGEAEVSGSGAVTTPMVVKKGMETFYYVTMEGISVGNKRIDFGEDERVTVKEGNLIIDSGTTVTMLALPVYEKVMKAVKSVIKLKQIPDPSGILDLCYSSRSRERDFPEITIHFRGADVKWRFENAFVKTSDESVCFAAQAIDFDGFSIFGNLAQANFLVGFDLLKKTVSFKPAQCGGT
ncbi:aspartic proteinase CDR1-like [Salvia hispanica]|uniref:aspartic proteinase CDR1-like n=1 Tax=Salvia hispanica TaxID=49212 RepID=UPI0020099938|nr:aspartic proteinase CDR1-like [Salvia hispanica]